LGKDHIINAIWNASNASAMPAVQRTAKEIFVYALQELHELIGLT